MQVVFAGDIVEVLVSPAMVALELFVEAVEKQVSIEQSQPDNLTHACSASSSSSSACFSARWRRSPCRAWTALRPFVTVSASCEEQLRESGEARLRKPEGVRAFWACCARACSLLKNSSTARPAALLDVVVLPAERRDLVVTTPALSFASRPNSLTLVSSSSCLTKRSDGRVPSQPARILNTVSARTAASFAACGRCCPCQP